MKKGHFKIQMNVRTTLEITKQKCSEMLASDSDSELMIIIFSVMVRSCFLCLTNIARLKSPKIMIKIYIFN